jgi:hypothetical protein
MNDSDFNTAWREFAKHDEETTAPARLRGAVMVSWDSAQQAQRDRDFARARRVSFGVMLAAAAAVILVLGITILEKDRGAGTRRAPAETPLTMKAPEFGVSSRADSFRLIADPAYEAEAFEIVRVRLPRTSLEGIGVTLIGPEVTSLVDVDVVVGGDGLPRAIHRIRPVVAVQ